MPITEENMKISQWLQDTVSYIKKMKVFYIIEFINEGASEIKWWKSYSSTIYSISPTGSVTSQL